MNTRKKPASSRATNAFRASFAASAATFAAALCLASPLSAEAPANAPIVLETQGSFTVGGGTLTHEGTFSREHFLEPQGQVAYGDHAYVFYQVPVKANAYPIVFQHGGAQT